MTPPAMFSDLADAALIHRFIGGDEQAFRALYRRHTPRLRMTVQRLLGARVDEVDDVVQETWLAGCRGIHQFNGDAQFSSWLASIGIRAAYRRFGDARDAEIELVDELHATDSEEPAAGIDLERALRVLPDHHRTVVVPHDIEGFTHEEIGRQLGVATGTSKATLSRARCALRRLLHEEARNGC
ncbi:MAG: RNA polymerase sigma factor [Gemmatimonadota bacterium]|nr:RNA polymerase sigma factor [Gemmatimonadota bacterium]